MHTPDADLLHSFFAGHAQGRPDALAVIGPSRQLSYGELLRLASQLARLLRSQGVKRGDRVGMFLPRSENVYLTLLATLQAGAAYVPIDPDYPPDRVRYILEDSGAAALVTVAKLAAVADFAGCTVLLDEQLNGLARLDPTPLSASQTGLRPDDLAYIIYTSGSTGRPKGVEIEHRAAANLVRVELDLYGLGPGDRVLQGFSIAFDASVEEVWMGLATGATLVVGTKEMMQSGPELANTLTRLNVTAFSTVPTLLMMLEEELPTVRLLIVGGEACPPEVVTRWAVGRRMVNTYGPTEATVICTACDVVPGKPVTIGKPLPTYEIVLLDHERKLVGPGQEGELYIGGVGLARGYVGRPEQTAERFLTVDLPGGPRRLYRSGDLGRWNDEGEIVFLGRADSQVKIRGYRVELSEIENVLLEASAARAAAVNVLPGPGGVQQLVGYLVLRDAQALDEDGIKAKIRQRLPGYMVPAVLEVLADLPTLPSGKVDRRALPAPTHRASAKFDATRPPPTTPTEVELAAVYEAIFEQPVSIRDDFFDDLGGHSLLAARVVSRLRTRPGLVEVSVRDLYQHRTLEKLARVIETRQAPPSYQSGVRIPVAPGQHFLCGLDQLAGLYIILGLASLYLLVPWLAYRALLPSGFALALTAALGSVLALYPLLLALALGVKWLVIGKFRKGHYRLWGMTFFRWWLLKGILGVVPIRPLAGTPLLNVYLRLMGAKIGQHVHLATTDVLAFDLLSIDDDTSIGSETVLSCCRVYEGVLEIGPVAIGKRCFVGDRCVVQPGATLRDDSSLEDLSLLRAGMTIPVGKCWGGSPASPTTDPHTHDAPIAHPPAWRVVAFSLGTIAGLALYPALILLALAPGLVLMEWANRTLGGGWSFAGIPVVAALFVGLFALELIVAKWLLLGRARPGVYPRLGWMHLRKRYVDALVDLALIVLRPVHASLYQAPWYRLLGLRVGAWTECSTATSYTPDLVTIGERSFIADHVSLGAARVERGWVHLEPTTIGSRTFIGNGALLPRGTAMGDDCLIGCLSVPPASADEAAKAGCSWLGSPAFLLPRREQGAVFAPEQTFQPTMRLWWRRAAIEAIRILTPTLMFLLINGGLLTLLVWLEMELGWLVTAAVTPILFGLGGVTACLFTVALKWLVIGRYGQHAAPLWSGFVWRSELVTGVVESLADVSLVRALQGTPFIAWYFRLMGAKIGRRVYLDTVDMTEYDLVTVGDEANVDHSAILQTHLFEDRVMKMSYTRVGPRCNVGARAIVLYDTSMEEGATLEDLSLLMKGESLPANTAWTGVPAMPVS